MALHDFTDGAPLAIEPLFPRPSAHACALCDAFDDGSSGQLFAAGRELCRQGEASYRVYRIKRGAVATYRLFADGRRQVMSFSLPGDFIGLEAGVEYGATAVALVETAVDVMRRSELSDLASGDPDLASALWGVTIKAFQRSEEHALVLARHGAVERVAAFLVEFAARTRSSSTLDLPMSRQDLADYLGLTIHTVSRTLSHLEGQGLIEARSSRQVRLLRPDRLEGMAA